MQTQDKAATQTNSSIQKNTRISWLTTDTSSHPQTNKRYMNLSAQDGFDTAHLYYLEICPRMAEILPSTRQQTVVVAGQSCLTIYSMEAKCN